ncbi:hypothetical protein O9992_27695 [Vibrio lentus]|nr:hypothetical protein [Vibrio lentus]
MEKAIYSAAKPTAETKLKDKVAIRMRSSQRICLFTLRLTGARSDEVREFAAFLHNADGSDIGINHLNIRRRNDSYGFAFRQV